MKVKDILESKKSQDIHSVPPDTQLLDAIHALCEKKIGALLVIDAEGALRGIVTERDVLWEAHRRGGDLTGIVVADVMTRDLICALPEDKVEYVKHVMTQSRVRHIPIMRGKEVAGVVSIGDVIRCALDEVQVQNRMLQDHLVQAGQL